VRVIQRLRFVREHVVELSYTVINLADLDHAATAQEFPTVYTANGNGGPDLWRLFNSAGTEITIDTPGNDGFFYENFDSPAGWVTMQNDNLDYGVGMLTESRRTGWQGWQLRSLPFNNFRPFYNFGIAPMGTVHGRSYLILGGQSTVAAEAQWLDTNLAPFGWLDAPAADAQVSGVISLAGWALDNKGVTAILRQRGFFRIVGHVDAVVVCPPHRDQGHRRRRQRARHCPTAIPGSVNLHRGIRKRECPVGQRPEAPRRR
jgi:hypothetical protein